MRRKILFLLIIIFSVQAAVFSDKPGKVAGEQRKRDVKRQVVIWRQPRDIRTRNLFYGSGGQAGQPRGPFRFIKENRGGSNPKFVVEDARGVRWKVKFGNEAKPETAATRLLWAVGYFADVNYYLPRLRVAGLPRLGRGQKYVSTDGTIHGARLERVVKKVDDWSWFDNPFAGTKEFNGLRVMMALMNNWDLKQNNNAIYNLRGRELRYVVNDLGDTFGKTGGDWSRSQGNLEDFLESEFVDEITPKTVDLILHSRPPILYAMAVPYYVKRVRMRKVAEDIPRAHARWMGGWLNRLSNKQIRDAFRAADYTPHEANAYTGKVRERIRQLNEL
ncbi:MAG: hypothetical protein L0229_29180 [Blastocatellia bacterium]|nr:hypothetical protein [Blastocatellia bacterium]